MDLREEYAHLSDEELAARFRDGEKRVSFTMIVERYQRRIYYSARKLVNGDHDEADEIAQETFVKVYEALHTFRGDAKLYTWIYRIMMNAVIYKMRRKKVRKNVGLEEIENTLETEDHSPHERIERQEMTALIEEAIATVPPKQREVFLLRFYDEMPYEEMSQILGTSVGGLKANYFHAVKKIGEFIQRRGNVNWEALEKAGKEE
ncbi:MAG: sigma-70 family RNA polymerase sigma factor [Bacteroidota bacterium]|nr:sigma-70 family RNA polymerase sigma factor [Bacteroidota bacterium]MDP4229616.1 sigma-70 family RNA polymerase sigma factor [Bacteroidota bacterium]MDP4235851.1 sigma-70 family RNA polymerase sigma factor [Bacteroidota bacterium]